MPMNLKNLLSRSKSRSELKEGGTKNEEGPERENSPPIVVVVSPTFPHLKKCETVIGLSPPKESSRVRVMRNKILSSSSSTLNSIFYHNRSKNNLEAVKASSQANLATPPPLTPLNRLRAHGSKSPFLAPANEGSRYSSLSSVWSGEVHCRLCLSSFKNEETVEIGDCLCRYCKECVIAYIKFEISEGADEISCPDSTCEKQGIFRLNEIQPLVPPHLLEKFKKFRLDKQVERDPNLIWCPTPGCETVCSILHCEKIGYKNIECLKCSKSHCADCKLGAHPKITCTSFQQKLLNEGKLTLSEQEPFAAYDTIKKCPFCHVPIEKDSGCAQMMCKRCKHVFCWYCLISLDDDFLLRHYDKGPCKNKLGHSRASVIWHRAQVVGIFAGFGLLVLIASPLLILAAPCLLCCRCHLCSSNLDLDEFNT